MRLGSRRQGRSVRIAAIIATLAMLALVAVPGQSQPAAAQSVELLTNNAETASDTTITIGGTDKRAVATRFRTGGNGPYSIESIAVDFGATFQMTAEPILEVWSSDETPGSGGATPGTRLYTFTFAAGLGPNMKSFTAPGGSARLASGVSYWIVVKTTGGSYDIRTNNMAGAHMGTGSEAGWSFHGQVNSTGQDTPSFGRATLGNTSHMHARYIIRGTPQADPELADNTHVTAPNTQVAGGPNEWAQAQRVRTGTHPGGFSITSVTVDVVLEGTYSEPVLAIHASDEGSGRGRPGRLLYTLEDPLNFGTGLQTFWVRGPGVRLEANTSYWVVLYGTDVSGFTTRVGNDTRVQHNADGWSLHGWTYAEGGADAAWEYVDFKETVGDNEMDAQFQHLKIAIRGSELPVPVSRVSNLGQLNDRMIVVMGGEQWAQSFCTGSVATLLTKVRMNTAFMDWSSGSLAVGTSAVPVVTIRSDNSGTPGPVVHTLTNPNFDTNLDTAEDYTTTSGYTLSASTRYWLTVGRPASSHNVRFFIRETRSTDEDSESRPGWGIGERALANRGGSWAGDTRPTSMKMAVYAGSEAPTLTSPFFPDRDCDDLADPVKLTVNENADSGAVVGTAAAYDLDGDPLTYSVTGTDAARFNETFALNADTGEITVKAGATIDYEGLVTYDWGDSGRYLSVDNSKFAITVQVTDGEDSSGTAETPVTTDDTVSVEVEVINVEEPGAVNLASDTPTVGSNLAVTLADPDGFALVLEWVWERGDDADGPFTAVDGASNYMGEGCPAAKTTGCPHLGSNYTPTAADQGKFLKVSVTYFDFLSFPLGVPELRSSTRPPNRSAEIVAANATVAASQQRAANNPPTGGPGISGSPRTDETLTATTSGILDADGLTNASFTYQWVRHDLATTTDTDIAGATGSTYIVTDADEGKAIKVRVMFTDDAGNEETMTSNPVIAAPPAVIPDEDPVVNPDEDVVVIPDEDVVETPGLTATNSAAPASHDGTTAFTFELRFSEEVSMGYEAMRDHVFTVTGGTVTGARRLAAPSNIGWEIRVTPSGNGDVVLALPVTSDCDAQGAVCTGDGVKLSEEVNLTVPRANLTATSSNAPTSHDGTNAFTFELRFSEEISIGYEAMRDSVLTVTGGAINGARRLASPSNIGWEIRVTPSGNGDVVITLPVTADCTAQGAICTGDGRKLSEEVTVTIGGPGG